MARKTFSKRARMKATDRKRFLIQWEGNALPFTITMFGTNKPGTTHGTVKIGVLIMYVGRGLNS